LKNPEVIKYQEPPSCLSLLSAESDSKFYGRGVSINIYARAVDRLMSPQLMYLYRGPGTGAAPLPGSSGMR
jgi:hypothetical protein